MHEVDEKEHYPYSATETRSAIWSILFRYYLDSWARWNTYREALKSLSHLMHLSQWGPLPWMDLRGTTSVTVRMKRNALLFLLWSICDSSESATEHTLEKVILFCNSSWSVAFSPLLLAYLSVQIIARFPFLHLSTDLSRRHYFSRCVLSCLIAMHTIWLQPMTVR